MKATLDPNTIKATALSVMPPQMAAAESELREIELAQADVCAKIAVEKDVASGVFQSARKIISQDDRRAAQARLDSLNAEAARLDRTAAEVRGRIREFGPANAVAVRDAMTPLRKAAAQRIVDNIDQLIGAIECLNATGLCLRETGAPAAFVPAPLLDGMRAIAKSIVEADSTQQEKR